MDFKNAQLWRTLLDEYNSSAAQEIRVMEVCGTHTHAIARYALRTLLPEGVTLISGPGCPVCVSGALFIEKIRHLLRQGVTVTLFGDLLRIPGTSGTLMGERNLRIVYSPADALHFALENPGVKTVFAAVGFAPTLAAAAALMAEVEELRPRNFSILSDFKEIMPVLQLLCREEKLSGLLLPGHVASITGLRHFKGLGIPGVISGFEPENILHSLHILLKAHHAGEKDLLVNNYPDAVRDEGNIQAQKLIDRYFSPENGTWRGLGNIPQSRYTLQEPYAAFDTEKIFDLSQVQAFENPACRCGEVLTGKLQPESCPLFGTVCTPEEPAGACMASPEGSCAASFKFREGN